MTYQYRYSGTVRDGLTEDLVPDIVFADEISHKLLVDPRSVGNLVVW